jgi:hypothetical protein
MFAQRPFFVFWDDLPTRDAKGEKMKKTSTTYLEPGGENVSEECAGDRWLALVRRHGLAGCTMVEAIQQLRLRMNEDSVMKQRMQERLPGKGHFSAVCLRHAA